jgi:hypothetical protein
LISQRDELGQQADIRQRRLDEREHNNSAFKQRVDPQEVIGIWAGAFREMLDIMTHVNPARATEGGITVSMGSIQQLLGMRLSSYPVTLRQGRPSQYDSFFYAAEFGTGVGSNTGGRVRFDGPTKAIVHGQGGFWWYGTETSDGHKTGALFSGQAGTHFLFEPGSETPNPRIKEYIGQTIQEALVEFLKTRR